MLVHKMKKNKINLGIVLILIVVAVSAFAAAGVGIKWERESALAEGGEKACLTYGVYNPWPEETYVKIGVSDELLEVLEVQDINATLVPAHTSSGEAIPIEFCFEVPEKIYTKNCWLGGFFVCEQQCKEEMKIYDGDVEIKSVPSPSGGGSSATMAVSAPLKVKVKCVPYGRDYTLLYVIFAVIALVIIALIMKYRKPKAERVKEEMNALKAKMKSLKKK